MAITTRSTKGSALTHNEMDENFEEIENRTTDTSHGDNVKANFGASNDLQIYHDSSASHSYITESGTGSLIIKGQNLRLRDASDNNYVFAESGGAVTLYNNNSAKLATTSTGINVSGGAMASLGYSWNVYTENYGIGTPNLSGLQIYTANSDVMKFGHMTSGTTFTERMRIDSSGNVGIGASSSGARFYVQENNIVADFKNTYGTPNDSVTLRGINNSGTTTFEVWADGDVRNSNNSYSAISDIKLKENIVDATSKLDDLMKVKVRNYNLIGDDIKQIGVIAQELEEVFPSLIKETTDMIEVLDEEWTPSEGEAEENRPNKTIRGDTTTKSVKYSVFVPILIKALQEANAKIEALEARIEALEA